MRLTYPGQSRDQIHQSMRVHNSVQHHYLPASKPTHTPEHNTHTLFQHKDKSWSLQEKCDRPAADRNTSEMYERQGGEKERERETGQHRERKTRLRARYLKHSPFWPLDSLLHNSYNLLSNFFAHISFSEASNINILKRRFHSNMKTSIIQKINTDLINRDCSIHLTSRTILCPAIALILTHSFQQTLFVSSL